MTVANNAEVVFEGNHAYHVGGAIHSTVYIVVNYRREHCSISFGNNSKIDLLHNTAERGGSAMYGIFMSDVVCYASKDSEYEYLFDYNSAQFHCCFIRSSACLHLSRSVHTRLSCHTA